MGATKQKAVISAEKVQLERVRRFVAAGRYRTISDFVREAVEEKLERLDEAGVAEAVKRYCAAGHADEDTDLIGQQGLETTPPKRKRKGPKRATR